MKKLLAILLAAIMIFALVSCWTPEHTHSFNEGKCECGETDPNYKPELTDEEILAALPIMSYEEYVAAAIDDPVAVECYVQAHQSWWDNKITVYAADEDGAYFLYELACSEVRFRETLQFSTVGSEPVEMSSNRFNQPTKPPM